jgi:hypothetical protein
MMQDVLFITTVIMCCVQESCVTNLIVNIIILLPLSSNLELIYYKFSVMVTFL